MMHPSQCHSISVHSTHLCEVTAGLTVCLSSTQSNFPLHQPHFTAQHSTSHHFLHFTSLHFTSLQSDFPLHRPHFTSQHSTSHHFLHITSFTSFTSLRSRRLMARKIITGLGSSRTMLAGRCGKVPLRVTTHYTLLIALLAVCCSPMVIATRVFLLPTEYNSLPTTPPSLRYRLPPPRMVQVFRRETPAEAIDQDRKLQQAWEGPNHSTTHHTKPRNTTPHLTTPHHTTPHLTTPHPTTPHHTTPHHITPHRTAPHHTAPNQATPLDA